MAAYQQAMAQYQETVLKSFKDVSDVLKAIQEDAKEFKAQAQAEQFTQAKLHVIQEQFRLGGQNYLSVLQEEKEYEETRIKRIEAQAARYTDTVALFQALGGGWWNRGKLRLPQPHNTPMLAHLPRPHTTPSPMLPRRIVAFHLPRPGKGVPA